MLYVTANNLNEAWRTALRKVYEEGGDTDNDKYWRDEPTLIDVYAPVLDIPDPDFPMSRRDLEIIERYIFTGENEEAVVHEWTKLYYHRMFDEPNSQMAYLLGLLGSGEPKGGCQVSMWDKTVDQDQEVSPCTQVIWARRRFRSVELHVHAHSSDAYGKLLMNLREFVSLHHFIAREAGFEVGRYLHFVDSCHIHSVDATRVKRLLEDRPEKKR